MTADEALFRAHLEEWAFRSGVDRKRWGFPSSEQKIAWPHCILWVQADVRFAAGGALALRFTLNGYSAEAPSAVPWDTERDQPLPNDKWPKGPGNVSAVFKPSWNNTGLYCPCDGVAQPGHEAWKTQVGMSQWWWTAESSIALYLEFVHRCLNPSEK